MRPLVPIDLFARLEYPGGLLAGPGGAVCFTTKKASLETNRTQTALWLYRPGAKAPARLPGPENLTGAWWAGPGRLLLATAGGEKEAVLRAAGLPVTLLHHMETAPEAHGEPRQVTRLYMEVEDAAPLPDGRMVLHCRWDPAAEAALAQAGGEAEKAAARLAEDAGVSVFEELPFWEDGDGLVAGKRRRLYLLEGDTATPLTGGQDEVTGFSLSPCGTALWYTARRWQAKMPITDQLFCLDMAGGTARQLALPTPHAIEGLAALDATTAVVAGSNMATHGLNQNPSITWVQLGEADSQNTVTPLYSGGRYAAGNMLLCDLSMPGGCRWQADGGKVYWLSTVDEEAHLMCIDAGTGAISQVSRTAGAVQSFARLPSHTLAVAMRGQTGPELYRIEDDGTETQLSHFNDALLAGHTLAAPQPVRFSNADGRDIRGFVLAPPGLDTKKDRCPAILSIHGGPKAAFGTLLFHEMQYWAAQGFAVLFCNPTGSDGRGDDFADIRGRYGTVDYDDLMGFTDAALAACPFIDPGRLGVAGGSYGGFMVNWMIGHTGRFKAAVSQRGISSWASMGTLSDIGWYFAASELGTTPWRDAATVWEKSPLKYADKVTTPTLFIHSDEDYRCAAAEGMQLFAALMDFGVPTRLCLFHGEGHELSRSGKPKARLRRLREMTEWFKKYL